MIAPILDQRDRVPIRARAAKLVDAAASAVPIVRRERYRPASECETRYPVFQIVWRLKSPPFDPRPSKTQPRQRGTDHQPRRRLCLAWDRLMPAREPRNHRSPTAPTTRMVIYFPRISGGGSGSQKCIMNHVASAKPRSDYIGIHSFLLQTTRNCLGARVPVETPPQRKTSPRSLSATNW
jgi:hypothetical protein